MKKSMIASLVALGLVSGLAQAADKEIKFVGSVTAVTCDIEPSVDGSDTMMPNTIQLGTVATGETGKVVDFRFKPSVTAGNQSSCDNMQDNGTVSLTWTGDTFSSKGLGIIPVLDANGNLSGTAQATDAFVEITPKNAKTAGSFIQASNTTHEFAPSTLKAGGDGLQYQAVLQGGQVAGAFQTAAKFNFSYK